MHKFSSNSFRSSYVSSEVRLQVHEFIVEFLGGHGSIKESTGRAYVHKIIWKVQEFVGKFRSSYFQVICIIYKFRS